MSLNFPGAEKEKTEHAEFHKKVVGRAAKLIADTCNEQGRPFYGREIPDDAILLALCGQDEVQAYIEYLGVAGANEEKLMEAIRGDYAETMTPDHASPTDKKVEPEDVATRALSSRVEYFLNNTGNPDEFDPSWVFHMMLGEKTAPSSFRSAYTCKSTGAGLDMERMTHARQAAFEYRKSNETVEANGQDVVPAEPA